MGLVLLVNIVFLPKGYFSTLVSSHLITLSCRTFYTDKSYGEVP